MGFTPAVCPKVHSPNIYWQGERRRVWKEAEFILTLKSRSGPLTNITLNYGPLRGLSVMLSCMMDFILHKLLRSMKWDKNLLQLEFTLAWTQTETPEFNTIAWVSVGIKMVLCAQEA